MNCPCNGICSKPEHKDLHPVWTNNNATAVTGPVYTWKNGDVPQFITLDDLTKLLKEYDDEKGVWPENKLEGRSVYEFIASKLGMPFENTLGYRW